MRFLVDENIGPSVALWLETLDHNVVSVHPEARGMSDREIIQKSYEENRILITCDKDFGDLAFRERRPHEGVVLLRLENYRPQTITRVLRVLINEYSDRLSGQFVVATGDRTRFAGPA